MFCHSFPFQFLVKNECLVDWLLSWNNDELCWLASQQNGKQYNKQPFKASGNGSKGNQQMKKKSTKIQ